MKKKPELNILDLLIRYSLIVILGLGNIFLLYIILKPLTVYATYFILALFYKSVVLSGDLLYFNRHVIEIIRPCIAVSAYYLLVLLNLATPMPLKQRIGSLFYCILALFIINVLRLAILSVFFINSFRFFDIVHKIFWYGLSTLLVVLIWFSAVRIFEIKSIPVYSDIIIIKKSAKKTSA